MIHDYTQSRADLLDALHKHKNEGDVSSLNTISQARRDPTAVGLNQVVAPLVQIADSVRDLPGRKNVIWIGYGYASVPTEHLNKQQAEAVKTMLHDVTDRLVRDPHSDEGLGTDAEDARGILWRIGLLLTR